MPKIYNVLWIDDQLEELKSFIDQAVDHDIILRGFTSVEAGFEHLKQDPSRFDAILLDAKSFEKKNQVRGTEHERALDQARDEIMRLHDKKVFPFFVFTGQKGLQDDESFNHRYAGRYFKKGNDDETKCLFAAIKTEVDTQPETQLRSRYAPAFAACSELVVSEAAGRLLVKVLQAIEKPQANHDDDTHFNTLRQIVEQVFIAALRLSLLPVELIPRGKVNLANCTKFLSGIGTAVSDTQYLRPNAALLPKLLAQSLQVYTDVTSSGSHAPGPANAAGLVELRQRVKTPYLLASLTYQVLDLLVWFKALVEDSVALQTYQQNAWKFNPIGASLPYFPGVVSQINPARTAGTFRADTGAEAHIQRSTLADPSLNIQVGTRLEAVLEPNTPGNRLSMVVKTPRLLNV